MWEGDTELPADSQGDLLVFGYSCRLFRDDEKALYMNQGKHLIPWMGDKRLNLMIDRYDVRGALYDLGAAEAKEVDGVLDELEQREEELCDEERYFALYHDEFQVQNEQEEELKRLQVEIAAEENDYNQVGYNYAVVDQQGYEAEMDVANYDPESQNVSDVQVQYSPTVDEDLYMPPPDLVIPPGMVIPTSIKQNKIIVKTGKFIATQGIQMEILIKTKQKSNPLFRFLSFDDSLNPYYKHVVSMIKCGRYSGDDAEGDGAHKSIANDNPAQINLAQTVKPDLTPGTVSSAQSSPHCSYSNLISKIKEKQKAGAALEEQARQSLAASVPVQVKEPTPSGSVLPGRKKASTPVVGLVDYPSFNQAYDGASDLDYDSEDSSFQKPSLKSVECEKIKWPPPEVQLVIDKMACYIIKNGPEFESVVKTRADHRFEFLTMGNEYYDYYACKMQLYKEVFGDLYKIIHKKDGQNHDSKKGSPKSQSGKSQKPKEKDKRLQPTTISFSIKSRDQENNLTVNTTFPIESSSSDDEEWDDEERERRKKAREERRQARKLKEKEERESKEKEESLMRERLQKEEEERKRDQAEEEGSGNEDLYDIFKYAQEIGGSKLLSVGKPPVSPASQNGLLASNDSAPSVEMKQQERKKKAAAFLKTKLKEVAKEKVVYGPTLPPELSSQLNSASQSPQISRQNSPFDEETLASEGLARLYGTIDEPKDAGRGSVKESKPSCAPLRPGSKDRTGSPFLTTTSSLGMGSVEEVNLGSSNGDAKRPSSLARHHKSRSHCKKSLARSASRSPSVRRERKKRKRSHAKSHSHKKKKHSSKSHGRNQSKRVAKRSKHSSRKEKARKKKHRKHRTPSSSSSSSDVSSSSSSSSSPSSSESAPAVRPSGHTEVESDPEVQVIESPPITKVCSRSLSIVSVPSPVPLDSKSSESNLVEEDQQRLQNLSAVLNSAFASNPASEGHCSPEPVTERRQLFDPKNSTAMAKIAQGLRAKVHALLEKENRME